MLPAVDAARAEAALQQVLAQGRPAIETFAPGAAGAGAQLGQRIFHWFGVNGPDGALCGVGLVVIAGGTGPATEEALRRSEERYRALVQGGAQITWVASPDGEMLEDSTEWRWITGQSVEEFLGNGWLESIHPEDRERVERDWRESPAHRPDLRRAVPDADQERRLPALRRARGADRAGREDRRVGRRLHRRDQPARGRGDAATG